MAHIDIDVNSLVVSTQNIRKDINSSIGDNESSIEELSKSIEKHGLINPISVRKIGEKYDIFAGQRRFLAMKKLGWDKIPCILTTATDDEAKTRSLIENFHRQDNTYEEKVNAFTELYENCCQKNTATLCTLVGLKSDTVKRYLRLSTLPPAILSKLDTKNGEKRLTLQNADDLVGLNEEKALEVVQKVLDDNLSTKQIKEVIVQCKRSEDTPITEIINNVIIKSAEDKNLLAKVPCQPWIYNPDDESKLPILIPTNHIAKLYTYLADLMNPPPDYSCAASCQSTD